MHKKEALIIFVKNAEKGKVKTRLAQTLGEEKALRIYRELMKHTRQLAESVDVDRLLFYNGYIEEQDEWNNDFFQKAIQSEGDLGARMMQAFEQAFRQHEKVVIIGSDCASLTSTIIREAFARLNEVPFVIGPALDGGYYLLGMRIFTPELFRDIEWSTDQVFPLTLKKIAALNQAVFLLPKLSDIDYEEDWLEFGWELED